MVLGCMEDLQQSKEAPYSGESPRIWTSEWCAGYTVPASHLLTSVMAMTGTLSECQEPVSVAGVHHSTVM